MKKLTSFLLLLPLLLAGCAGTAVPASGPAPSLPKPESVVTPELPEQTEAPAPALPEDPEAVPVPLELSEGHWVIQGPAGTVEAPVFLGPSCQDPCWADLDGDGRRELVFWASGPTSGLFTAALCVFSLEEGWPVQIAQALYNLSGLRSPKLEQEADEIFLSLGPSAFSAVTEETEAELRLPLSLRDGALVLGEGELPKGIQPWGGDGWNFGPRDLIRVSGEIPTQVENLERWEAFLAAEADQYARVDLLVEYPESSSRLTLIRDARGLYTLTDREGNARSYPYLLCSRETDPPATARFHQATHYLLSEDPEMSWERYFAHMVSSFWDPEFPASASVFTVYQ